MHICMCCNVYTGVTICISISLCCSADHTQGQLLPTAEPSQNLSLGSWTLASATMEVVGSGLVPVHSKRAHAQRFCTGTGRSVAYGCWPQWGRACWLQGCLWRLLLFAPETDTFIGRIAVRKVAAHMDVALAGPFWSFLLQMEPNRWLECQNCPDHWWYTSASWVPPCFDLCSPMAKFLGKEMSTILLDLAQSSLEDPSVQNVDTVFEPEDELLSHLSSHVPNSYCADHLPLDFRMAFAQIPAFITFGLSFLTGFCQWIIDIEVEALSVMPVSVVQVFVGWRSS